MKPQINEIKRMQQLAGIKTNLNESIGGYRDIQPLKEAPNFNGMPIDQIRKYADAGDFDAQAIVKHYDDLETQRQNAEDNYPDADGNCKGNKSLIPGMEWMGCMEEGKECPDCEKNESFDELDEIVDKVLAKMRKN